MSKQHLSDVLELYHRLLPFSAFLSAELSTATRGRDVSSPASAVGVGQTSPWGLSTAEWIIIIAFTAGLFVALLVAVVVQSCLLCRLRRESPKYRGAYDVTFAHEDMLRREAAAPSRQSPPLMTAADAHAAAAAANKSNGRSGRMASGQSAVRDVHTPPDGQSMHSTETTVSKVGDGSSRGGSEDNAAPGGMQNPQYNQQRQQHENSFSGAPPSGDFRINDADVDVKHAHHMAYYDAIP
jgi:hypothetical protein